MAEAAATEKSGPGADASANVAMGANLGDSTGAHACCQSGFSSDAGPASGWLSLKMASASAASYGNIGFSGVLSANVLPAVPEPAPMAMLAAGQTDPAPAPYQLCAARPAAQPAISDT